MGTVVTSLITSIGGTGVARAIAAFFGKKWLGKWIDAFFEHKYAKKLKDADEQRITDKALFEKFLEDLPSSGSIETLISQRDVWSFRDGSFKQLWNFQDSWGRPEHSFLDDMIEEKRKRLHDAIVDFLKYKSLNTWRNGPEYKEVPGEWSETMPERFEKTIATLNQLSVQVIQAHEELIRTARNVLKC